ncbi:5082_t:CDS:2 [Funneliformis geosporum]|uniref:5082_t:CDS:1 n=1 Tax=Funneliformis geosporum TaxID=1117311 RepID=A0A9W4SM36_9GLOM|nr:5082_t:CDS:2 [Funneliformis geosporum]
MEALPLHKVALNFNVKVDFIKSVSEFQVFDDRFRNKLFAPETSCGARISGGKYPFVEVQDSGSSDDDVIDIPCNGPGCTATFTSHHAFLKET